MTPCYACTGAGGHQPERGADVIPCADCGGTGEEPQTECPAIPDRFGAVFPDGAVYDATDGARMFGQDPEQRARTVASNIGGRPVLIRTTVEWLPDA